MPEKQQPENGEKERRRGRDRRKGQGRAPETQRALVLLAKLISVLLGTLLGLLATNIISYYFVEPLRELTRQAEDIVKQGEDELLMVEPELNRARQEWAPLENLWISLTEVKEQTPPEVLKPHTDDTTPESATPQDEATPDDLHSAEQASGIAAVQDAVVDSEGRTYTKAELADVRERYQRLNSKRQRLMDQTTNWREQVKEYDRSINAVNMLGIVVVIVFTFVGYLFYPLIHSMLAYSTGQWEQLSTELNQRTTQAVIGFMAGVVIALVVMLAAFNTLSMDSGILALSWFRLLLGAFIVVLLGLSGSLAGVTYFGPTRQPPDPFKEFRLPASPRLLDSSVIIDGRVHEIAAAGFMGGILVITNSVLRELQTLADSSDERRRSKGRRGLELVRKMQEDPRIDIKVFDDDQLAERVHSTDELLIHVANEMSGIVATNDYNLNRVAAIRNVRVININELANAVKTNHIPGDFIEISIVDRGKQHGQGVGYLPDGTMIVVEDGEPYIGQTETIKLTSVTQTVAGRLIFGRVDLAREEQDNAKL